MPTSIFAVCGSLQKTSANRSVLAVAIGSLDRLGLAVDDFDDLGLIPPLNADFVDEPGTVVADWRRRIGMADAVLIAAPEYGGAVAGVIKNALDWVVGSGELYRKPVALLSAGTSGGVHARRMLVQTLTWQGAHVVASLGISSPRTKSDANGAISDPTTIADIEAAAAVLARVLTMTGDERLALVNAIVAEAGVDPGHIAPVV